MSSRSDFALYRRLLGQAKPYWYYIGGIVLLGAFASPLALLTPLPLKIIVDSVVGAQPAPDIVNAVLAWLPNSIGQSEGALLVFCAALLVGIELVSQLHDLATSLLRTYTSERMTLDFRAQLFRQAQRLSLAYHDAKGTTDSAYRVQHDASAVSLVALSGLIPLSTAGLTLVGMIYVTARIDWQLAALALTVSPVIFLISRIYRGKARRLWRAVKKLDSSALSMVQEALSAIRVVKAFGQEDRERERFANRSSEGMRARVGATFVEGRFGLLAGMTTTIGTAVFLFVGVRHVQEGTLTLGELLLVMSYLSQLYSPLKTISKASVGLQSSLASAERAFALFDEAPDVVERPNARPVVRAVGAVSFRDVSFAYGDERPVLQDISFEIPPGTRLGITGATGAGKTTLVNLLTRFYDPSAGQILLDGIDLRDYRLADLRRQFALVLQEPVLFSASIAENIAYARPDASEGEIVAAARAANAHEFIVNLPEGYATQVGERGMRLSGGERQRISLARAFLRNASILILDEPTSSIDMATENLIMEAIDRLMEGRTTFMIAHRLTTLMNCDLLLVIENGRMVTLTADVRQAVQEMLPVPAGGAASGTGFLNDVARASGRFAGTIANLGHATAPTDRQAL